MLWPQYLHASTTEDGIFERSLACSLSAPHDLNVEGLKRKQGCLRHPKNNFNITHAVSWAVRRERKKRSRHVNVLCLC